MNTTQRRGAGRPFRAALVAGPLIGGCLWITDHDENWRWDIDGDGVERPDDCDDRDPTVSPDDPELCDPDDRDEDCDGAADDLDESATGRVLWCTDIDQDGFGWAIGAVEGCDAPAAGWTTNCGDCDDANPNVTDCDTPPVIDTGACAGPPRAALSVSARAGEAGITSFVADASSSAGTGLVYRFDWGDGALVDPAAATESHTYASAGWRRIVVEVEDACDETAAAEAWVAVSEPGALLRVTTGADEQDSETFPPPKGVYLGTGLSLREALSLAQLLAGAQVITFDPSLTAVTVESYLPSLSDAGGVLVGYGVSVDAAPAGRVDVVGSGAVVAGIEIVGSTDPAGAIRLIGSSAVARDVVARDNTLGIAVSGTGASVAGGAVRGSSDTQIQLLAQAVVHGVDVAGGDGVGVDITGGAAGSTVELCRIHGHEASGVEVQRDADEVSIVDSTIVANGADGVRVAQGARVKQLDARNLILADNGGWGFSGDPQNYVGGGNGPSYTLWWSNGLGDCDQCQPGQGSVTADPLLADPTAGDLTPRAGSPVIDAGTPDTLVDRNGPTDGSWFGGAPDLGAIEVR